MSDAQIRAASSEEMDAVRAMFREYADWLRVDYCLQDFEAELAGMPGAFAPPAGGLWLAWVGGDLAGCIGYRSLGAGVCEMRRLWVREAFRGHKLGRQLVETALKAAREVGYGRMSLEALGHMAAARSLYAALGFRAEHRDYEGLEDDLRYMVRDLTRPLAA